MQAASREAYAAAAERLEAYLGQAGDPAAIAAVAADLASVADLLRREPRLRRVLSDPARAGADRSELINGVLTGKVSPAAAEIVAGVVADRWSAPSELLNALERLSVSALLASADVVGDLGEVEDELFRFGQVVDANPALSTVLADRNAPIAQRAELVRSLLAGKAKPATVSLAEMALAGFGGRSFAGALTKLVELAAERREKRVAYVTVAAPLDEAEEQRLGAKLSQLYGRDVTVKQTVDPSVLGGMSVQVGADLYDGTVLRRLTETRNALAKR
ncbi:F0F1 ATP synthase subunit delta [Melissospora conviva]|uniref:F0F1 ATP synthase subunit delta n=1 Tax=Melissospora conviva TaxID=3388432 RepID=UPI003B7CB0FB